MFNATFDKVLRVAFIALVVLCVLFGLILAHSGCDKPKLQVKPVQIAIIQSDTVSTAKGWRCDTHIYHHDVDRRLDTVFRFKKR